MIHVHAHAHTGPWHRECVDIVERSDLDHMWAARRAVEFGGVDNARLRGKYSISASKDRMCARDRR